MPEKADRDRWLSIELRHLAALATVAEHASFSCAAEHLGYVQSAVSQQIRSLERIVGRRLVDRSARPRSVSVTEAGRTLLDHVDEILEQLRLAKTDVDALSRDAEHAVSFGMDAIFGCWLAAAVLSSMDTGATGWETIEHGTGAQLLRRVEAGELDAAFVPLPIASGPFFSLELVRRPCVLVAPAAATDRSIPVEAVLARFPLVVIDGCPATAAVLERSRVAGAPPGESHYAASGPASALPLVRAGVAVAVMADADVPDDARIATLPLPGVPDRVVGLAWHRERDDQPSIAGFRAMARRAFREAGHRGV